MMGKDVERVLSGIDRVKDESFKMINTLVGICSYSASGDPSKEVTASFTKPIINSMQSMSGECSNMNKLGSELYTGTGSFNNSYGSPWTELSNLQRAVDDVKKFTDSHDPYMTLLGEKLSLMGLIQRVHGSCIDARWAFMYFHDYVQRGYDYKFNGKQPSITFASNSNGDRSTGNINHQYDDNVHIPTPPIEVF